MSLGSSPVRLLLVSLFSLGLFVFLWFRERNGGIGYKRMLHGNNGSPPRLRIMVGDSGMKSLNLDINQEVTTTFPSIRYLMESKNLLVLVDDLKMCHPIDKQNLEGGSSEELTAYLKQNCPKLKKRIRTGRFGRICMYLCIGINILALIFSLVHLLEIPERLNGQLRNSMSYQEMALELESLEIYISEQTIREMEEYDAEYALEYGEYYQDNPTASKVLDLLYWEGAGVYDEEAGIWTPSPSGVYWFDMEYMDVSRMYTDFLNGVAALDDTLTFSNITEDCSRVDLESGEGLVIVGFDYLGKHYEFAAKYDYGWFDVEILRELALILDSDADPENLWYSLDGQALYLYYGTAEQAELLKKKTGTFWLEPVNNPLYNG